MKQNRVIHVPKRNECMLKQIRKMSLLRSITVPPDNQSYRWNYHVMPHGINRQVIFEDDEAYM